MFKASITLTALALATLSTPAMAAMRVNSTDFYHASTGYQIHVDYFSDKSMKISGTHRKTGTPLKINVSSEQVVDGMEGVTPIHFMMKGDKIVETLAVR